MGRAWAIAVNTIKQALRMKVAVVFLVLLLVLLPVMAMSVTGDGTLKGRLQTFVSYGLSLTSLLLCLFTIIVSIYSITSDIEQGQICTIVTKPIRRFEIILGKFIGVVVLDIVLLVVFAAIIYAVVIYMPKFSKASEDDLAAVKNEFYTARTSLVPAEIDVSKEVAVDYKKLIESQQMEQLFPSSTQDEIIASLTKRRRLEKQAAAVGQELVWEFNNVRQRDPNESLFVRFKYDVSVDPTDSQVWGRWLVGDYRQIRTGSGFETAIYRADRKDPIRTFREVEVPADAVAEDGYVAVSFYNVPLNNTVVIFPLEDGLEVLYKADTFTANYIRGVLLILCRLIFLACLGVLAATFLSFPVAILLCIVIFFMGTISGFILESFGYLGANLSLLYSYSIKLLIELLPRFDQINPTKFLVPGRLLAWGFLGKVFLIMVFVKATVLLVLALLIFSFREIAKIVV